MTNAIADNQRIRNLVHQYADATSRRDPAAVASSFTIDGEWHAPELGHFKGRDAMVAFFTSMLSGWNVFLQGLLSDVVVVDATNLDRATGCWFVQGQPEHRRRLPRRVRAGSRRMADRTPPLRPAAAQHRWRGDDGAVSSGCAAHRVAPALSLQREALAPQRLQ
jgi:ketosteroid isomerase-like protein